MRRSHASFTLPAWAFRTTSALVLAAGILCTRAVAQPVPYFEDHVVGPAGYGFIRSKSCVGPNGSIYVANELFPNGQDSLTDADYLVSRIAGDGSVMWQYQIPNPPALEILIVMGLHGIRATPDGGVLVAMEYTDDQLGYTSINKLMKFSATGTLEWTRATNIVTDLIVDPSGNIFLTDWEYHHGGPNGAPEVSKITPDGQLVWSQFFGLDGVSAVYDLQLDGAGGVTALGWVDGTVWDINDNPHPFYGICPVHFTGLNDGGTDVTQAAFNGFNLSSANTRDAAGNSYAYGWIDNSDYTETPLLVKMDPAGNALWQLPFNGVGVHKMLPDGLGNLIVWSTATGNTPTQYLQKYDGNGNLLWSKTLQNTPNDFITDPGGDIFLLATIPNVPSFGMIKYLPSGELGWPSQPYGAVIFSSTSNRNAPDDIQRDSDGRLYMNGTYSDYPDASTAGILIGKYGPPNDAKFKSQTVPGTMVAGQTYNVVEAFTNTAITPWTMANGFYLRSANPTDNKVFGKNHIDLAPADSIEMGQSKYFNFSVIAPMTGGNYNFMWRMSQGTHAFGATSTNKVVNVVVRQNAARYISETIPTSVTAGSTFSVSVTMMNVGTTSWTSTAGYGLVPVGATTWGVTKQPTGATTIARGATKTFTFSCHAPVTAGSYHMQFQMRRNSTAFTGLFGDLTASKTITVTP